LQPRRGGWWFDDGAIVSAARWCEAALSHAAIEVRGDTTVDRLRRAGDRWFALDGSGRVLGSAPIVVVASAFDAPRLLDARMRVVPIRGRISRIDGAALDPLRAGLTGDGYLVRGPDGWIGVGATYEAPMPGDEAISTLDESRAHAGNLARLPRLLAAPPEISVIGVFDALRCVSRDRLPCAGPVVDVDCARAAPARMRGAHPIDLPRQQGLYASFAFGSRGLSLAALAAELIAAQIEGEPAPIERNLANAIDPGRQWLRALRRSELA
jgi:tRNA 5-methylaminomethyl-2-thiouridine biosynthesis bifunctional protein